MPDDYAAKLARLRDQERVERERMKAEKDPQGPVSEVPPSQIESHAPTDEVSVSTSTSETGTRWTGGWGQTW